ncbi:MAG TPA: type 1 glutamine amidotransferase domain-containing protein [Gaiellaceae bacterium]|nr:type 1 glutamine amidotransferase domain-containing protein [Gaiellaceae bacterium]
MARVLLPVPDLGFDVTEVAVPWRLLALGGHEVVFCTERGGAAPSADPLLISGVIFGRLGARPQACAFYRELERDDAFRNPVSWMDLDPAAFDGVLLPGGHAPGTRQYLDSTRVQEHVASFFDLGRPVGAICHGVLVAARSIDRRTGRSVLYERTTTCLARYQELGGYLLTFWKLGRYYRTYYTYVEDEVKNSLRDAARQFKRGPLTFTARDSETDSGPAFVVCDGMYVSARWPGDAYTFARRFQELLEAR